MFLIVTSIKYNLGRILAEFGKLEVSDLVQLTCDTIFIMAVGIQHNHDRVFLDTLL